MLEPPSTLRQGEGDALAMIALQLDGTVKDGAIELQGDHRERVAFALTQRGWRFKHSGG